MAMNNIISCRNSSGNTVVIGKNRDMVVIVIFLVLSLILNYYFINLLFSTLLLNLIVEKLASVLYILYLIVCVIA